MKSLRQPFDQLGAVARPRCDKCSSRCRYSYLKPFDARLLEKWPVRTRLNPAENDDEECSQEAPIATAIPTLF